MNAFLTLNALLAMAALLAMVAFLVVNVSEVFATPFLRTLFLSFLTKH